MILWSNLRGIRRGAFWKAVEKGRIAGLSKESAGEAPNLMRRPVQQENRDATTSACVGWDELNIENRPRLGKSGKNAHDAHSFSLKWFHNHQDDNADHEQRRHFVDNA